MSYKKVFIVETTRQKEGHQFCTEIKHVL